MVQSFIPEPLKIVSGGQTGVDRAALDIAVEIGLRSGGWCPRSRIAEDGTIPERYMLRETPSSNYDQRTVWNVRDADGTLILVRTLPLSGGTAYTLEIAREQQKPVLVVVLDESDPADVSAWLRQEHVLVLNVAGPRESTDPEIGNAARDFLRSVFSQWVASRTSR